MAKRTGQPVHIGDALNVGNESERVERITGKPLEWWEDRYRTRLIDHLSSRRLSPYRWYLPSEIEKFGALYGLEADDIVYALVPVKLIQSTYPNFKAPVGVDANKIPKQVENVLAFRLNPAKFGDISIAA